MTLTMMRCLSCGLSQSVPEDLSTHRCIHCGGRSFAWGTASDAEDSAIKAGAKRQNRQGRGFNGR